jgi:hypothetical protein
VKGSKNYHWQKKTVSITAINADIQQPAGIGKNARQSLQHDKLQERVVPLQNLKTSFLFFSQCHLEVTTTTLK